LGANLGLFVVCHLFSFTSPPDPEQHLNDKTLLLDSLKVGQDSCPTRMNTLAYLGSSF